MGDNILITGGAGFIGYHLAKYLIARGEKVTLVDNFFRGKLDDELKSLLEREEQCVLLQCDLTNWHELEKIQDSYDQVYHLAALMSVKYATEMPQKVLRDNMLSTINTLDWFAKKGKGRILLSSTSEVYSSSLYPVTIPTPERVPLVIDDVFNPRFSYKGSKILGEMLFVNYAKAYGMDMTIVRYHNVYGSRMGYEHVIPELSLRILKRENPFRLYSPGQSRAFCYIDDAIEATARVMACPQASSQIINIGNDSEEILISDLASRLFKIANYYPALEELPPSAGSPDRRCPDISKLRSLTGFAPRVRLDEGLKGTFQWYKADYDRGNRGKQ